MAILEAIRKKDWERLGVLLGVEDHELGELVAGWARMKAADQGTLLAVLRAVSSASRGPAEKGGGR